MKRIDFSLTSSLIGCALLGVALLAQQATPAAQGSDISRWKTFTNRAGWAIKHPSNWRVGSCNSCSDPTDPNVFVTFSNPSTDEMIMVEHLIDKPSEQSAEQWLNSIKKTTNLNPSVGEEWITVDGTRALKVINRNPDSTESQNIYVIHESKTFAIRTDVKASSRSLCERMLSTFRFTGNPGQRPLPPLAADAHPPRPHLAGMGAEAAVATASAFEEPATAVGRGTLGAGDQASELFGEALVDGVDEACRAVAHNDSVSIR